VATNGHLAIPVAPQASKLVLPAAPQKYTCADRRKNLKSLERTTRKVVFRPTRWLAPGFVTFPYKDLSVLYHRGSTRATNARSPQCCEIQIFGGSIRIPKGVTRCNYLPKIFCCKALGAASVRGIMDADPTRCALSTCMDSLPGQPQKRLCSSASACPPRDSRPGRW